MLIVPHPTLPALRGGRRGPEGESHRQDGETLRRTRNCERVQHPAILPWPSGPPVIGRATTIGPSRKSAAALLPDDSASRFATAPTWTRGLEATHNTSAADAQPLDQ